MSRHLRRAAVLGGLSLTVLAASCTVSAPAGSPTPSTSPTAPAAATSTCTSRVAGDVNGDGFAEVAIGAPDENGSRGAVHLLYGYRGRLVTTAVGTALNDQLISLDSPGVPGESSPNARFGVETALADFNGDGCADLAVGAWEGDPGPGSITVLYGSRSGLRTSGSQRITATDVVPPKGVSGAEFFGNTLTTGDLDGDGRIDLVSQWFGIGSWDSSGLPREAVVLYGAAAGLTTGRASSRISAATLDLSSDWGLGGLAVGDFDGDGRDELAVSGNRETTRNGATAHENGVYLVQRRGDSYVLGRRIFESDRGFPRSRWRYEGFSELAVGDIQGDGRDDLALGDSSLGIGEPESEYGRGAVVVLLGSRSGLTTTGSQFWTPDSPGVAGRWDYGDEFGGAVAFGRLDGDRYDDLVVGASGSGIGGSVTLLRGSRTGLTTAGAGGSRYSQSSAGNPGTDERGDGFGAAVAIVHLAGATPGQLIIGTPTEAVGSLAGAGAFTQLDASSAGPVTRGSQTLTQDSPGLEGTAAAGDTFGLSLSSQGR